MNAIPGYFLAWSAVWDGELASERPRFFFEDDDVPVIIVVNGDVWNYLLPYDVAFACDVTFTKFTRGDEGNSQDTRQFVYMQSSGTWEVSGTFDATDCDGRMKTYTFYTVKDGHWTAQQGYQVDYAAEEAGY